MYNYGIIGFGGLGKTHLLNLCKLEKERGDFKLKAICGTSLEEATKSVKINLGDVNVSNVNFAECDFYDDYKEMLDNEKLDFVFSVLPTYLHEEVAIYALKKGVNVFSEKPMALTLSGCEKMMEEAKNNNCKLFIGHCQRFHPAYSKVKEYIENKTFGKVRRAEFSRYSQMPLWTWNNWILDSEKSGGCIIDMHIHDVDLMNWFFGMPKAVNSVMTEQKIKRESISSYFKYDDFVVISQADWALPQSFPFSARLRVDFENASVLIENDNITVYTDEKSYSPEIGENNVFFEEEKAFLSLVIDNEESRVLSAESVFNSMKIVNEEIEAAKTGKTVCIK